MKRARLPRPIAPLLAPELQLDGARLWSQIAVRRADRVGRARTRIRMALGVAGLAALGVALWSLIHMGPYAHPRVGSAPLALADRQALPRSITPRDRYRALALDDGSYLTVAAGARLDVLEASGRVASFALRDGRTRFDIRPHGPRRWRVDCGAVTVEVVGTAFVLERDARAVSVQVLRGAVLVRGESVPDRVQRLGAGQQLMIASEPRAAAGSDAARPVTPAPAQPEASIHRNTTSPRRAWREAARDAQWNAAFAALDHGGLARELRASSKVDDLLLLADVARLSGHPGDAVAPLGRIVREHPRDPRAALAAFTLGRIRLDALGDPAGAIADIERALGLGLPHALAKDARSRLAEARQRLGASEREGASAPQ